MGGQGVTVGTAGDTGAHHGVLGQVVVGAPRDGVQLHEVLEVGDLPQDPFLERRERQEMGLGWGGDRADPPPAAWQCPFQGHHWSQSTSAPTAVPSPMAMSIPWPSLVPQLSPVPWPSLVPQLSPELWPCPPHGHPWFYNRLWSNGHPHPIATPCSMATPALRPSHAPWLSLVS